MLTRPANLVSTYILAKYSFWSLAFLNQPSLGRPTVYWGYRAVACFWPPVSRIWHILALLSCWNAGWAENWAKLYTQLLIYAMGY